jgi:predicted RNA-binding protein with PIN domain
VLERLAAEHRGSERVCLVSSDMAIRGTSGQEVTKLSSTFFVRDLDVRPEQHERPHRLAERLDPKTRDRLEKLRRNRSG